ncbi:preprotein translocase subunit SecE [Candidatus Gottesmanbacteria bacterium]|nr:preprotein translocase subunit SecE [Candidatus Gottesmanbacteria bacterium]
MATEPITFIKEVRSELAKVVWPTREQTVRLTVVVLALSITIGFFIGGLDIALTKITEILVKR